MPSIFKNQKNKNHPIGGYEQTIEAVSESKSISEELVEIECGLGQSGDIHRRLRSKQHQLRSKVDGLVPYEDKPTAHQKNQELKSARAEFHGNGIAVGEIEEKISLLRAKRTVLSDRLNEINALTVSIEVLKHHQLKIDGVREKLEYTENLLKPFNEQDGSSEQELDKQELKRLETHRQDMLAEELLEAEDRFDIEKVDKDILEIQSKIKAREQPLAEAWATAEGLKRKKDKLRLELDSLTALYPMLKSLFLRKKISETSEVYERQCNDIRETCQQLAALEHLILGVSHAKDQDASPLPIWQINLPSMMKSSDGYTLQTFAASDIRIGMDEFVSDALEEIKKSGISLSD